MCIRGAGEGKDAAQRRMKTTERRERGRKDGKGEGKKEVRG